MSEELPEGWVVCRADEVCALVQSGGTPKGKEFSATGDVPFLKVYNLVNQRVDHEWKPQFIPKRVHLGELGRSIVRPGDVLMNIVGPPLGKVALVPADYDEWNINQAIVAFRTGAALDQRFLYYSLCEGTEIRRLANEYRGSAGQSNISLSQSRALPIPLPPLSEQRRIVARVEELLAQVDAAKERLAKAPAILKRLRQSVLAAACSGKLTEDWRALQQPAPLSTVGGDLPERWEQVPFGNLIEELRNGISTRPSLAGPGTPILRISAARPGAVDIADHRFLPDADALHPTYGLRDGDLLFTRYNGSLDLLGVCGMVRGLGARQLLYPDKLMRVRVDQTRTTPEYIEAYFQSPNARDAITAVAKSSAGQQGISGGNLKDQRVLVPPVEEQREITRRVAELLQWLERAEAHLARASAQADGLGRSILAKAFRAELVPTEAELARGEGRDYETGQQLLARVGAVAATVASGGRTTSAKVGSKIDDTLEPTAGAGPEDKAKPSKRTRDQNTSARAPEAMASMDQDALHAAVFTALWPRGPLEKDVAVRLVAEHLRDAGSITYQRLRADGPLYATVLDAVESSVKEGLLDRGRPPRRGYVRAIKAAQALSADDWRHALATSLDGEPTDREDAIRVAAEWARENMGLDFERLRSDGHIAQALRSAINSAVRRGEIIRHDAKRISRAENDGEAGLDPEVEPEPDGTQPRTIEHSKDPRQIEGSESVLVLQFQGNGRDFQVQSLVAGAIGNAVTTEARTKKGTHGWVFYLGLDRPHVEGLSTWVGIGKGVPSKLVDLMQKLLEATGASVHREYAAIARHQLHPFVVVTDHGVEVPPVGPTSPDDHDLEHFEVAKVIRRPFVVSGTKVSKQDQLVAMLLGPDTAADA